MVSILYKKALLLAASILMSITVWGQTIEQGRAALAAKEFQKAKEIFSKIIRQQPGNASVCTWYGQACFETGDYIEAEKYLTIAAKRRVLGGYFYLAKTQSELYKFEEAEENFDLFLEKSKDQAMIAEAEAEKQRAERGAALLRGTEEIEVIDSLVVDKTSFLSHYKLSDEAGHLYRFQDFFESNNNTLSATVFENQRRDKIIYGLAVQGRGYDLYSQVKLLDKFGDSKPLPDVINSEFDENFPFIMSDGATIYYASNNPEKSLGGYDIMVTRYSISNDGYLSPENAGMPFNSPANDYMLVIDDAIGVGWFASDRNQPEDKVCIYIFIPNAEKKIAESESDQARIALAKLTNIKATQKSGNRTALLNAIQQNTGVKEEEVVSEIEFVISDMLVYHFKKEFVSPQARTLFDRYASTKTKLESQEKELESLRSDFAKATQAKRQSIGTKIASLEISIPQLYNEMEQLAIECRSAETKQLRK